MNASDSEAATGVSTASLAAEPGRELEIKFKTDAAGLKLALRSELLSTGAADAPSRTLRSVYFDTPAGDLRKQRMVLRVRTIRASHVIGLKWAGPLADGPFSRGEIEVRAPGLDPDIALFDAEIAGEVSRIIDGRPLEQKFETRIRRRVRQLDLGRAQVEVAFDDGFIIAGDRKQPLTEVELELKGGEEGPLYELALQVAAALPLRLDMMSKAERGFMLAAGDRPMPVRAAALRYPEEATLDDAVEIVTASALGQFAANWPALTETRDPESIHQMRVALRRLRSALAFFNRALPCAEFELFRGEAKRIASAFGPARNWDAFLDLVEKGPLTHHPRDESFTALLTAAEDRRLAAYAIAQGVIADPATTRFVLNLRAFVARRAWRSGLSGAELPRLTEPAKRFAAETLERLHKRALKRGRGLLEMPPEERHQLRIALKNLRYAAEFFSVLFGGGAKSRPYIRAVAQLQDGLGAYNDEASAAQLLQDLDAAAGSQVAKASGVILGWCGRGAVIGDANLGKAWKSFKRTRLFWR
ncbi:CYTH and CHAD domain-containing protein [Methylocapsa aurea]|uniref:CYTH and CHAD domain-containing protein n=1 Tax=Methylocapsa aurea TaxID=663610 RepID=UPI00138DD61D|nr:CYTH and CHAD domain-containing protein [Methylocapsa aurea]